MRTSKYARRGMLRFLSENHGLVTLEWVALAAAVIFLSAGVVATIHASLNTAASRVGSNLITAVNSNS